MGLTLTSAAFDPDGDIPSEYTCDGSNISPPLSWSGLPEATQSLALIVEDPDAPDPAAPQRIWTHWILYNLPPDASGLAAGASSSTLPPGTQQGLNDWKNPEYGGPCPPIGRHRYFHKLYALDCLLPDLGPLSKAQLEKAMHNHVIDKAELIGRYQRK